MRKKIIAGNWKMHLGAKEAASYCDEFKKSITASSTQEWVLFSPAVSLPTLQTKLTGSQIKWGAQNCHFESKGAFTGEISPLMLKELGCEYSLVGHSERRQLFGETDDSCAKKIKSLTEIDITPMYCIGETQEERDQNKTNTVLLTQIREGLKLWNPMNPLTLAYEPVWAIGTGRTATANQAEEAHQFIRKTLAELFGGDRASEIQILYGGSVKPDNARELGQMPNIDGFLVGGASLTPKTFAQIGVFPL